MNEPETRPSLLERIKVLPPDESAWQEFDAQYRRLIVRFARRRGLNESDAEDVASQTMAGVAADIREFEYRPQECRFRSWLYRRARGRIVDGWRRQGTRLRHRESIEAGPGGSDPLRVAWDREWERFLVEAALASMARTRRLDPRVARVLHELYAREKSAGEVAEGLELSRQDVYRIRSRWHDALAESVAGLRRSLGGE